MSGKSVIGIYARDPARPVDENPFNLWQVLGLRRLTSPFLAMNQPLFIGEAYVMNQMREREDNLAVLSVASRGNCFASFFDKM